MKWMKIEEVKVRESGGLGAIIAGAFGKTAKPAISLFPFGFASKPIKEKRCASLLSERNGDNLILGYNFKCEELEDGESIIFSTNEKEERQAQIKLYSRDNEGRIEIKAAKDGIPTASIILDADGGLSLSSTDEDGEEKANILLKNNGKIEINSNKNTTITIDDDGKLTISAKKVEITSDEDLALKGKDVTITALGAMEIKGSNGVKISGSGSNLEIP